VPACLLQVAFLRSEEPKDFGLRKVCMQATQNLKKY